MSNEFWNKAWAKETQGLDFATARKAGRATKEKILFVKVNFLYFA